MALLQTILLLQSYTISLFSYSLKNKNYYRNVSYSNFQLVSITSILFYTYLCMFSTTGFIGSLNYEYLCFEGTHP